MGSLVQDRPDLPKNPLLDARVVKDEPQEPRQGHRRHVAKQFVGVNCQPSVLFHFHENQKQVRTNGNNFMSFQTPEHPLEIRLLL